jgi:zinc transport system ATP-binding protein
MNTILELKNISAGYNRQLVLRDINLTITRGDFIAITGPNGGGKTTLLKTILGLLPPRSGQIIHHNTTPPLFGYLPQNNRFDPRFPVHVEEIVLSGLDSLVGITGRYTRAHRARARQLLAEAGIDNHRHRPIGTLSGGQQQRALLCRAIIARPAILLLDEPAAHLDNTFENHLHHTLRQINQHSTIIIVTHHLHPTRPLAKTILHLRDGKCQKN